MCTETNDKLDDMMKHIRMLHDYYATIQSQLKIASSETHDYSELMCIGGPQGIYKLKAPWNQCTNVQFKVDTVTPGGQSFCNFLISSDPITNAPNPQFGSSDTGTTELSPIRGIVLLVPQQVGSISVNSCWYDVGNSSLTIYMSIITGAAGYANIQFRKKR